MCIVLIALLIIESASPRSCACAQSTNEAAQAYAMAESLPESYIKRMMMIVIMINIKQPMNCLEFMEEYIILFNKYIRFKWVRRWTSLALSKFPKK